jgi:hypothetical protein
MGDAWIISLWAVMQKKKRCKREDNYWTGVKEAILQKSRYSSNGETDGHYFDW